MYSIEILHVFYRDITCILIPVNPPPLRGSLPHKSLISRMDWVSCAGDINLPHTPFPPAWSPPQQKKILPILRVPSVSPVNFQNIPPVKKIKYNKILTYILRSIFLEIPHLELPRWLTPRDTNGKGECHI
jgi:hypothetical protein